MSEHKAKISWSRTSASMDYDVYNREHEWGFDNGTVVKASSAPAYKGKESCVDPEEALIASASGCHMLTFLAIASKKKFIVDRYEDNAVGYLEKNETGEMWVSRIILKPKVTFSGAKIPTAEDLKGLHEAAHRHCFIANSIKSEVTVEG